MPCKVVGRSAQDAPVITQPSGDETIVSQLADPNGGIEALPDQVDETVGVLGLDRHLRVSLHEIRQHAAEPSPAHGGRQGQAAGLAAVPGA